MRILVPVDGSRSWLEPVERLKALRKAGIVVEALLLNVQPLYNRHIASHSSRASRDALRAARGQAILTPVAQELARAGVPFTTLVETGDAGKTIAAVARREKVDDVLIGVRPPSLVERLALPVGLAGLAALLAATE